MTEGQLIRIPLPELNEERREELVKVAGGYAEQARVAVRNVRRDGMDQIKKAKKDSEISQDDAKLYSDEVQELTDKFINQIDETLETKEGEIRQGLMDTKDTSKLPTHIAIIMDGNGRWAQARGKNAAKVIAPVSRRCVKLSKTAAIWVFII